MLSKEYNQQTNKPTCIDRTTTTYPSTALAGDNPSFLRSVNVPVESAMLTLPTSTLKAVTVIRNTWKK